MNADVTATCITLSAVGGILAVSELSKRVLRVPTEWSRKVVHIGVGVVAAFVPSLFTTALYPIACGALLLATFAITRKIGLLSALHGVRRATSGVIAFPLAGIALMALTGAHGAIYVLPLLVVALADAAAALVGRPFGKHKFHVGEAVRSIEGSLAFAVVAFLTSLAVLFYAGVGGGVAVVAGVAGVSVAGVAVVVAISLGVALLSTVAEALTQRGWDNFVIPLVVYAVLVFALAPSVAHLLTGAALLAIGFGLAWLSGVRVVLMKPGFAILR